MSGAEEQAVLERFAGEILDRHMGTAMSLRGQPAGPGRILDFAADRLHLLDDVRERWTPSGEPSQFSSLVWRWKRWRRQFGARAAAASESTGEAAPAVEVEVAPSEPGGQPAAIADDTRRAARTAEPAPPVTTFRAPPVERVEPQPPVAGREGPAESAQPVLETREAADVLAPSQPVHRNDEIAARPSPPERADDTPPSAGVARNVAAGKPGGPRRASKVPEAQSRPARKQSSEPVLRSPHPPAATRPENESADLPPAGRPSDAADVAALRVPDVQRESRERELTRSGVRPDVERSGTRPSESEEVAGSQVPHREVRAVELRRVRPSPPSEIIQPRRIAGGAQGVEAGAPPAVRRSPEYASPVATSPSTPRAFIPGTPPATRVEAIDDPAAGPVPAPHRVPRETLRPRGQEPGEGRSFARGIERQDLETGARFPAVLPPAPILRRERSALRPEAMPEARRSATSLQFYEEPALRSPASSLPVVQRLEAGEASPEDKAAEGKPQGGGSGASGGADIDEIVDRALEKLSRMLEIEGERRGVSPWH